MKKITFDKNYFLDNLNIEDFYKLFTNTELKRKLNVF